MKDIYFIVEGDTEVEFVNKILIPYLYSCGLACHIQAYPITMSGGGHGMNNIQHFINTVTPVLHYNGEPIITTLLDYFQLNSERKLPGFNSCTHYALADDIISCLESKLNDIVQEIKAYRFFVPYIQKHEMETLFFSDPLRGFDLEPASIRDAVAEISASYANIEDINGSSEGAPSKRLNYIYEANGKRYDKVVDGIDIAELTGIGSILAKCSRFRTWLEHIILMSKSDVA
jgi:hypothetical protein